ncbi:MAG TPA: hypothetical protein VI322_05590, partial [Candidatus Saccharimonadia bacterium]
MRDNLEAVKAAAKNKNAAVSAEQIDHLVKLDDERRSLLAKVEDLRRQRNELSAEMKHGKPDAAQVEAGKRLKTALSDFEQKYMAADREFLRLFKLVPNLPTTDVPVGASEDENQVAKTVGEPPKFDFEPKNHWQIAEAQGWIDKERAAKVAGARFAYLKGNLVRLHMAMIQFALDVITDEATLKMIADEAGLKVSAKPFVPVLPPFMIRTEAYDAMDRLEPRDDRYKIEGEELWLQGSAEH